jgi:hypothetical protein
MIILGLFVVILLIIFTICLPQILYIILVGFVGYVICKTLRRKQMGQMIVILCVFICLDIVCEEVMPIVSNVYSSKSELKNSVVELKNNDKVELNDNRIKSLKSKIWGFVTKYPNEKE